MQGQLRRMVCINVIFIRLQRHELYQNIENKLFISLRYEIKLLGVKTLDVFQKNKMNFVEKCSQYQDYHRPREWVNLGIFL